jgi:serine/threonine-protein kinase RsbT
MMDGETRVPIRSDVDIVAARRTGRSLAAELGFPSGELALIATAISEVARNIVLYARHGEIVFQRLEQNGRRGLFIEARDEGPGITNIELALQDGYSTGGSLGLGLPGARRMMDEFEVKSEVGKGTVVTMRKWVWSAR